MNKILVIMAALLAAFATAQAATVTLDINGKLYTETGLSVFPVSVSYNPADAVPWLDSDTYTIVSNGALQATVDVFGVQYVQSDDAEYPAWPGIVLRNGEPYSLDFVVILDSPDLTLFGVGGLIMPEPDGLRVQCWVSTLESRLMGMTADNPVPNGVISALQSVPEPQTCTLLAGFGLLGFVAIRRRIG